MDMNKVDNLMAEVRECRSQLELAWQNFDYAEKDMIDVAILDVRVKQLKYERLANKLHKAVFPKKKEENKFKLFYKKLLTFIK